jgi:hypothetical protein
MIETNKELKIEIAPTSNNAMSYDEAMLYCFILNIDGKIGWRMPTAEEYAHSVCGWFKGRITALSKLQVTPVRDIKDD